MTDMSSPPDLSITQQKSTESLRLRAEAIFQKQETRDHDLSPEDLLQRLRELQIQKIELELRNQELLRNQQEAEIARSRYFDLYDLAPVGYITLDANGSILEANYAAANQLGLSHKRLLSQPFSRFVHPEDYAVFQAQCQKLAATDLSQMADIRMLGRKNKPFWVRLEAASAVSPSGLSELRIVLSNITERKLAEQSRKESMEFSARVIHSMLDGFSVLDPEGVAVEVNPALCEMTGFSRDELIGAKPPHPYWPPEEYEHIQEALNQTLQGGIHQFELIFRKANGSRFPVSICPFAIKNEEGDTINFAATVRDITKRKKAEAALHTANQKLRLHFEQTPMAVIEWDLNFRVSAWNPSAHQIFGYSPEQAIGQHASFIVPQAYRSQVTEVWAALMKKNGGERSTNENITKNGALILCDWYNTPLIAENGTVAGVASLVVDITKQTEAAQILSWEKSALELIGSSTPLLELLDRLMLNLERQLPDSLCAVLLLDDSGTRLIHGAGPNLPPLYYQAANGLPIGPAVGSCGTAAFHQCQVICADIAVDPLWKDQREFALFHGLRACYSTPIRSDNERPLGTLAIYHRKPHQPTPSELKLIKRAEYVLRIAIKRKHVEETIIENEEKYRTLFENASDAIFLLHDDKFVDCNQRCLEIFKCESRDLLLGRSPYEFCPPEQLDGRNSFDYALEKTSQTLAGKPQFFEWTHRRLNGSDFFAEISLNSIELGGKQLVQAIIRDISHHKQAAAEIQSLNLGLEQRVEERTRELLTANLSLTDFKAALDEHAIVGITDSRGTITYANDKFCAISKFSREELIGKNHKIVSSGYHPKKFIRHLWKTITQGKVWKGEVKDHGKDGSSYWLNTTIVPFFDEEGKITQYIAIRTDITERKLAEEKIQKLNTTLQAHAIELATANKELEAFTYSVSHDLRAPLRAIDGFSRLIQEDCAPQLDADGQRKLDVIRNETQRMGRLIDDLLSFSRLGRLPIDLTHVPMQVMAQEVFTELCALEPERKIEFSLHPLPDCIASLPLIRQVWVNLISNAIKFTLKQEHPTLEIGSITSPTSEQIYYVKDNGSGFEMRHADKLFGVFQRLHRQQEFPGSGVGLALVHRIIERHEGRVWADAKINQGATFYFMLPFKK